MSTIAIVNPLDELKTKALETVIACTDHQRTKRPTFAPPLVIDGELLRLLYDLAWLSGDDLAVARLWARFTSPRRGAIRCDGFELRAGQKHTGGKIWEGQYFDKDYVLANLTRQIAQSKDSRTLSFLEDARRNTEAKAGGWTFGPRWTRYRHDGKDVLSEVRRIVQLGQDRVMDFAGAPGEQMRAAGKYCGHCCVCGKCLTDPHSIELGIGPECREKFQVTVPHAPGAWVIGGTNEAA